MSQRDQEPYKPDTRHPHTSTKSYTCSKYKDIGNSIREWGNWLIYTSVESTSIFLNRTNYSRIVELHQKRSKWCYDFKFHDLNPNVHFTLLSALYSLTFLFHCHRWRDKSLFSTLKFKIKIQFDFKFKFKLRTALSHGFCARNRNTRGTYIPKSIIET